MHISSINSQSFGATLEWGDDIQVDARKLRKISNKFKKSTPFDPNGCMSISMENGITGYMNDEFTTGLFSTEEGIEKFLALPEDVVSKKLYKLYKIFKREEKCDKAFSDCMNRLSNIKRFKSLTEDDKREIWSLAVKLEEADMKQAMETDNVLNMLL